MHPQPAKQQLLPFVVGTTDKNDDSPWSLSRISPKAQDCYPAARNFWTNLLSTPSFQAASNPSVSKYSRTSAELIFSSNLSESRSCISTHVLTPQRPAMLCVREMEHGRLLDVPAGSFVVGEVPSGCAPQRLIRLVRYKFQPRVVTIRHMLLPSSKAEKSVVPEHRPCIEPEFPELQSTCASAGPANMPKTHPQLQLCC